MYLRHINPLLNIRENHSRKNGKITAVACVTDKVNLKITQGINMVMRKKRTCKPHKLYKFLCCPVVYWSLTNKNPFPWVLCPKETLWTGSCMLIQNEAAFQTSEYSTDEGEGRENSGNDCELWVIIVILMRASSDGSLSCKDCLASALEQDSKWIHVGPCPFSTKIVDALGHWAYTGIEQEKFCFLLYYQKIFILVKIY